MSLHPRTSIASAPLSPATPAAWRSGAWVRAAQPATAGVASTACGTVLGLGCSGGMPWWVSIAALTWIAWRVRQSLARSRRGVAALHVALACLAMQAAGGWWLGLGLNPRGDAPAWRVLAVALTTALQTGWLVGAWALACSATHALPRRLARLGPGAAWCLAWGSAESLREMGATGYGYTSLGTAFLDLPGLSGWAAVIGVHGMSMLAALLAWLLAAAASPSAAPVGWPRRTAAAGLALLAAMGSGQLLSMREWTRPEGAAIAVTVVQDATDKRLPWSTAERDVAEDRLLAAVRATPRGGVVVTPEGHFAEPLPTRPEWFWQTLRDEVDDRGVHALVGMPQRALDGGERAVLNAIVQIAPDRFALYAKERLVPGGESLPMASLFSGFYDNAFQGRVDTPRHAQRAAPPELTQALFVAGVPVGASICHELSFTTTMAQRARGSAWLLNAADDAWIPSAAYRAQMAVIARARALELAKPLLRVTDGGASMLVGPDGRIEQAAPAATAVTLHWQVQPRTGSTPYESHARALSLAPAAALAILLAAAFATHARRLPNSAPRMP